MNKAFFFDRDGTLNEQIYRYNSHHGKYLDSAPTTLDQFKLVDSAEAAVSYVKGMGYLLVVVTNQPDFLMHGLPLADYEAITGFLCERIAITRAQVFECFHREGYSPECMCRKPKPGMIKMAQGLFDLDLPNSWLIGDSWKDIVAANSAGIKNTIFVTRPQIYTAQSGNEEDIQIMEKMGIKPRHVVNNLAALVKMSI